MKNLLFSILFVASAAIPFLSHAQEMKQDTLNEVTVTDSIPSDLYFEDDAQNDLMHQANRMMAAQDYKGTIAKTSEVLSKEPGATPALVLRARAKAAMSDTAGAFSDLRQAIQYNPESPDGYVYLSIAYYKVKAYREAYKWVNQGLEKDPQDPAVYAQRGEVKYAMGDKHGACMDWSRAGDLGMLSAYDTIFEKCTEVSMTEGAK